jgi:hypothetical protein
MKKIIVIVMGIMMFVLFSSFLNFFFGGSRSPGTKMAHKITGDIGRRLKANYGLRFMGISEEGPDGKYKKIGLEFSYNKIISKDRGRILLLKCAYDALQIYNSHPEFEQYMKDVPFTNNNIIINIYIRRPKGPDVNHPDIGTFSFNNSILRYRTYDPQNGSEFFTVDEESFEEAKRIVAFQQANGYNDLK